MDRLLTTLRVSAFLTCTLALAVQASSQTPQAAQPAAPAPAQTEPAQPAAQPPATGQQPDPNAPVTTIRSVAREVNLVFTVTDSKGRFINGLKQQNFALLDDGRPPERVLAFSQQTDLPLRVGILLDTSNSIRQRFQFEQDAATEFFLQVLHRGDAAFVTGFDVKTDLVQDYTSNIDKLNTGLHKLRPGGGTAFYDALYTTCRDQMLTLESSTAVRKALIVVSDGHDNSSHAEENDAIKMCQRAETVVYTISTNVSPSRDRADETLKRIAEATGGRAFFPNKIEDVSHGFSSIQEELRSQYLVRYRPAEFKQDGSFRTIYLMALDSRYHVNTRKGYFASRAPE